MCGHDKTKKWNIINLLPVPQPYICNCKRQRAKYAINRSYFIKNKLAKPIRVFCLDLRYYVMLAKNHVNFLELLGRLYLVIDIALAARVRSNQHIRPCNHEKLRY